MTEAEFAEVVNTAAAFWAGREWPGETLDVWYQQMQRWDAKLVLAAMPALARQFEWLPTFSQIAEGYALEKRKSERQQTERHLHAVPDDRGRHVIDPDLRDRWRRVIAQQLRGIGSLHEEPINRAVRAHYRRDATGLVVMSADKMLSAAEGVLADGFRQANPEEASDA